LASPVAAGAGKRRPSHPRDAPSILGVFSVSPAEVVTIAIVALLVFGPQKLPEIARKIGRIGREITRAAQELKVGLDAEYDDVTHPLDEVRRKLGATVEDPKPTDQKADPEVETKPDQASSEEPHE